LTFKLLYHRLFVLCLSHVSRVSRSYVLAVSILSMFSKFYNKFGNFSVGVVFLVFHVINYFFIINLLSFYNHTLQWYLMLYGGFPWSESKMVLLISSSSLNEYHHLACGFHPALPSLRKYDNSINVFSDLLQIEYFLRVLRFRPLITLSTRMSLKYC
jgi:hypothetical protein